MAEYITNLRSIVGAVTRTAGVTMVLATTTPVDDVRHRSGRRSERHEADVVAYNAALRRFAAELGVTVNDLYAVVDVDRMRLLGGDGVHLSNDGTTSVGEAVAAALRALLESR
jgi:lysophospholipase L1-like esterase